MLDTSTFSHREAPERSVQISHEEFLGRAGDLIASSLSLEETLDHVASLVVGAIADWCLIDLLEEGQAVRRAVVNPRRAEMLDLASRLQGAESRPRFEIGLEDLATGSAIVADGAAHELLAAGLTDPELLVEVRSLELGSVIVSPLAARDRLRGLLTLILEGEAGRYRESDRTLALRLGRRAGLAIDNAMLYRELEEANRAKDEFLAILAHEVRGPLTVLTGGVALLKDRGDALAPERRAELLDDLEDSAKRMQALVDDLLSISRGDLRAGIAAEPLVLARELSKLADEFGRRTRRRVELDVAEAVLVHADPLFLRQIVGNLMGNADKYTPAGKPVEVHASASPEMAMVSVRDFGPGLPEEELAAIFDPFYRSAGSKRRAGGSGIGLTACRRLVEALGGEIYASLPTDGSGLVITFTLPAVDDETAV
jgi:signal transduction histidine kinase